MQQVGTSLLVHFSMRPMYRVKDVAVQHGEDSRVQQKCTHREHGRMANRREPNPAAAPHNTVLVTKEHTLRSCRLRSAGTQNAA